MNDPFIHPSAYVDTPCSIGTGTKIWHFCHVMPGASIGERCTLGQNVFIGEGVRIGSGVRIQNNVSLFTGITVEDDVFLGPSCVFTNVKNPRAAWGVGKQFGTILIGRGATIGANATVVTGVEIGSYAFVAAGAVVTKDVPAFALMMGVPAVQQGWVGKRGQRLSSPDHEGILRCPVTGERYREEQGVLRSLDESSAIS